MGRKLKDSEVNDPKALDKLAAVLGALTPFVSLWPLTVGALSACTEAPLGASSERSPGAMASKHTRWKIKNIEIKIKIVILQCVKE